MNIIKKLISFIFSLVFPAAYTLIGIMQSNMMMYYKIYTLPVMIIDALVALILFPILIYNLYKLFNLLIWDMDI